MCGSLAEASSDREEKKFNNVSWTRFKRNVAHAIVGPGQWSWTVRSEGSSTTGSPVLFLAWSDVTGVF